jgi:hypothetical protein
VAIIVLPVLKSAVTELMVNDLDPPANVLQAVRSVNDVANDVMTDGAIVPPAERHGKLKSALLATSMFVVGLLAPAILALSRI